MLDVPICSYINPSAGTLTTQIRLCDKNRLGYVFWSAALSVSADLDVL